MVQVGRGDVDEVLLRGIAVLPIDGIAGRIGEALQLAQCFGQHGGIISFLERGKDYDY